MDTPSQPASVPQISVTMPVYNACPYLEAAIQGVLGQTMGDFELIAIDDGSTDGSTELLERFARQDSRIRLATGQHRGAVFSRNQALSMARAPLIAVHDADDVSHPQRFVRQLSYLADHPECVAVGSRMRLVDPEGCFICEHFTLEDHSEIDAKHLAQTGSEIGHSSALIRADAMRRVGGYRELFTTAHDFDLWLRLAEIGKLANLPDALVTLRLHEQSLTSTRRNQQLTNASIAVKEAYERRGLRPPPRRHNHREAHRRVHWAMTAWRTGNYADARVLARKAIQHHPFSPAAYWVGLLAAAGPSAKFAQRMRRRLFG